MVWPWLLAAVVVWWAEAAVVLAAEHRRPARAAAWLLVLLALPIVGILPFLLARGKVGLGDSRDRKPAKRSSAGTDDAFPGDERLRRALRRMSDAPITGCNGTEILTDGEEAFASIFDRIGKAEHHIHLAYYILRDDGAGRRFRDALIRKAKEGVQVRLIYDGFGSWKLPKSYIRELTEAGVRVRCFLPLGAALRSRRINHRYHRKIVIIDGKSGFTGGINIGDEYLGLDKRLGFWRDTHLLVEGDAVCDLQNIFVRDWELASGEALDDPAYWPPHACTSHERVQIVSCGPRPGGNEVYDGLLAAVGAARERIWIATPYFVPDAGLTAALRTAAAGGVDVRLIVPGIADTRFVLAATLSHAADLQAAGVRVYRYQKGFIHAKVMIVDRLLASVGTANLDMRSFYSNYELSALLFDGKPIGRLERDFLKDLADSREVTAEELRGLTAGARAGRAMARLLSPLL
ncbi:phosphatidylserine/phosphatidylglycerophosphate/cardiolipin synthase [Thermobacillus composti KWC4]|uniref:Cardiolipin synthase n=1 Tax=Thermobacillus composti (strain DSM 18247 / JCM 13945 / KWC4) TaxID=717605 RepID=L0EH09_THECK|nr:cardiolipin synthase [Thermobacillus composti]AGA59082.1 phosphatidylserine/phosphatidylglycerophosphate/cardiolipin synthase [Thermobacillus composti KWC4]